MTLPRALVRCAAVAVAAALAGCAGAGMEAIALRRLRPDTRTWEETASWAPLPTCDPSARERVEPSFVLPESCVVSFDSPPDVSREPQAIPDVETLVIRSDDELRARIECSNHAVPTVEFGTHDLVLVRDVRYDRPTVSLVDFVLQGSVVTARQLPAASLCRCCTSGTARAPTSYVVGLRVPRDPALRSRVVECRPPRENCPHHGFPP